MQWRIERWIFLEYGALEPLQRFARLETEILGQLSPGVLVNAKRFWLPAGAVQREHQLAPGALSQRMCDDERFQLRKDGSVPTERELGLEFLLERAQPQLVEAGDLGLREVVVGEVGEGLSPPKLERVPKHRICSFRIADHEAPSSLIEQTPEPVGVELVGVDEQEVATAGRSQARAGPVTVRCAERAPQARDLNLNALDRGGRRLFSPERVDQAVDRDHLIGPKQEKGNDDSLLATAQIDRGAVVAEQLKRAE